MFTVNANDYFSNILVKSSLKNSPKDASSETTTMDESALMQTFISKKLYSIF